MANKKSKKTIKKPFSAKRSDNKSVSEEALTTDVAKSVASPNVSNNTTVEVRLEPELSKVLDIIEKKSAETTSILQSGAATFGKLEKIVSLMVKLVESQQDQVPALRIQLDKLKSQDVAVSNRLESFETSQSKIHQQLRDLATQLSSEVVQSLVMTELTKQTQSITKHAEELRERLDNSSLYHSSQVSALQSLIETYEPGGLAFYKQKCEALTVENAELNQKIQSEIKDYHEDKIAELQEMIDLFGPGGAAVLQQKCEELERQNTSLKDARKKLLQQLEVFEIREREQSLIPTSPEEWKKKQKEIAAQLNEIKERVILQSEVERLTKTTRELENELTHLRGIQRANQDDSDARQDVIILREKLENFEKQNEKLSAQKSKQHQKIDRQKNHIGEIEKQLVQIQEFQEQYVDYQADLEQTKELLSAKDQEIFELNRNKKTLEQTQSQLETRGVEKDTKILDLQDEIRTLQQDDEQRQVAWKLKMQQEFDSERQTWFLKKEESLQRSFDVKHDDLLTDNAALKNQVDELKSTLTECQHTCREVQLSLNKYELTDQMLAEAKTKILEQSTHWEEHYKNEFDRLRADVQEEYEDINQQLDVRESELNDKEGVWSQARDVRANEVAHLEGVKGSLVKEIELLEQKCLGLEEKIVPPEEAKAGLLKGFSEYDEFGKRPEYSGTEKDWLFKVQAGIEDSGFVFHPRLLHAFHTALKISDYSSLVVLAGISGTGKSELPRLYSDLGGLPFFEIAVQPSWDSTQDLFGFFNYTDGRYKAEPLSRLLYDMTENPESIYIKHPVLWLLDEMNLARVEYYFADLLSKLETRRGVLNSSNLDKSQRAAIDLDMGPNMPVTVGLPSQLMFVGTMNDDESTLALSDKVLDRSSLLQFPRPKNMKWHQQVKRQKSTHRLTWETWTSWKTEPKDGGYTDKLNEMNKIMDQLGRPFGHRLFRNVQAYIANHPLEDASDLAFEDQFVMKIAPRLRGLETTQPEVKKHLQYLKDCIPESLHGAFKDALEQEFFQWSNPSSLFE